MAPHHHQVILQNQEMVRLDRYRQLQSNLNNSYKASRYLSKKWELKRISSNRNLIFKLFKQLYRKKKSIFQSSQSFTANINLTMMAQKKILFLKIWTMEVTVQRGKSNLLMIGLIACFTSLWILRYLVNRVTSKKRRLMFPNRSLHPRSQSRRIWTMLICLTKITRSIH